MLLYILGNLGTGKTLALTTLGFALYNEGNTVYSNYKVNFPHVPVKHPNEIKYIKTGTFLGDELHNWLDSRLSGTKANKIYSQILLRSRKRGYDIFYTAQIKSLTDKRVREITDFIGFPKYNKKTTKVVMPIHRYLGRNKVSFKPVKTMVFYGSDFFYLYNTEEDIYYVDEGE